MASAVHGAVIIAVPGKAQKFGILIEAITSACVGDQSEEFLGSKIVDPGKGSFGGCNDILPVLVIKVSILHDIRHPF